MKARPIHTPQDHLGTCSTHGVTCAICSKMQEFQKPFAAAHWARKYARFSGWTYIPKWGWVCGGCRTSVPGEQSRDQAAHKAKFPNSRPKGPTRIQIELNIK